MKGKYIIFYFIIFGILNDLFPQWGNDVRVTNDFSASYTTFNNARSIAVQGDTIHAVWVDERDGNPEIYYARSFDKGETWESSRRLTFNDSLSLYPAIAVKDSFVHIVWSDFRDDGSAEIYYKRSKDYGETFGPDRRITNAPWGSALPSIAVWGSTVHIVWADVRNYIDYQIYYTRSLNNGETFEPERQITSQTYYAQLSPSIAVRDSIVHIVWEDLREISGYKIYYTRSLNNGEVFEPERKISLNFFDVRTPCISVYDSLIGVVWKDVENGVVYFISSFKNGETWNSPFLLGDFDDQEEFEPSIWWHKNFVRVVWTEERNNYRYCLVYRESDNNGITWKPETSIVDIPNAFSYGATVVDDGEKVCLLWTDTRDYNEEIYFKKKIYVQIKEVLEEKDRNIRLFSNFIEGGKILLGAYGKIVFPVKIILLSKDGREILEKEFLREFTFIKDRKISNLKPGIYFLKVITQNKVYKFKLNKIQGG